MKSFKEIIEYIKTCPDFDLFCIDLFCGAGGETTGIEQAEIQGVKCAKVILCINHDTNAILSHNENHPDALHFIEDIRTLDLSQVIEVVKAIRKYHPESKIQLHASLECTNFSKAKGGQPRDADSRTLAEHLFRYIEAIDPDYIQIENVREFMCWGDMDENGKPISKDKGRLYLLWVKKVKSYGYDYSWRILNSANIGAYTSRERFFGQFAKYGLLIAWPESTHSKDGGKRELFDNLKKWKPVKDVLDLEDEGTSIFDRKKPLAPATFTRHKAGLIKFVCGGKEQYMIKWNSMNQQGKYKAPDIDEPCPVVSCQNRIGVGSVQFLSKYFSGHPESKNIPITGPAHTIKTRDNHALISADFLSAYYGTGDNVSSVNSPCPTVTTKDRFNLVRPKFLMNYYSGGGQHSGINKPSPTILAKPKQYLVSCNFLDMQYGASRGASIEEPAGTVTSNPKHSLVTCNRWLMNTNFANVGSDLDEPSPVITANRKWHYLINPQFISSGGSVDVPCFTLIARMDKRPPSIATCETVPGRNIPSFVKITPDAIIYEIYESDIQVVKEIKEIMAMYGIIDIKQRMLKIPELKRIMGFPSDYVLIGTQAEQKKFIGNAVEVNMARAICEATSQEIRKLMKRIA